MGRKLPQEVEDKILRLYVSGHTYKEIEDNLGVKAGLIGKIASKWKKAGNNRGEWKTKKKRLYFDEVIRLYKSGLTSRKVAEKLGITAPAVIAWVHEAGCEVHGLPKGKLHHWWKGGVPRERPGMESAEYKKWRLDVFKRDGFKCVCCGETGKRLTAHHILGFEKYPSMRLVIENGVTLCRECHIELHRKHKKYA